MQNELNHLDELIKSRFIEMFGDIHENTNNYPIRYLNEIAEYWKGLTYHPEDVVDDNSGILIFRSSNIQNRSLAFEDNVYVNCKIKEKNNLLKTMIS